MAFVPPTIIAPYPSSLVYGWDETQEAAIGRNRGLYVRDVISLDEFEDRVGRILREVSPFKELRPDPGNRRGIPGRRGLG